MTTTMVNTFPLDTEVNSVRDLCDGTILSKMIGIISPDYAVHDLVPNPGSAKWLNNKKSLEAVYRSLLRYIGDKCPNLDSIVHESKVDLNAIAEQKDEQETIKLLTIFLLAVMEGPSNRDYINLITTKLDISAQEEIKKVILEANSLSLTSVKFNKLSAKEYPSTSSQHLDLSTEEKYAALLTENENLKRKYADFMTRFERLTRSHEELIQHSNHLDVRLDHVTDYNGYDRSDLKKTHDKHIEELEDIIASQEQELEVGRVLQERQNREIASLRPAVARLTEYQDELKEVKMENLNLVKKANMVDHYLKKLENHTLLQRENSELREKIDLLDENQKDYDKVHEENLRYKKTAAEYGSRFQQQELHIVELSTQKNALKQEVQILNEKIFELNERQQHDEKFINDLQEQMRTSAQICPDSPTISKRGLSLEDELKQVEEMPNDTLDISTSKNETKIKQQSIANVQLAQLNIDLAESERAKKQLEKLYRELLEKYTTEQQSNSLLRISPSEKNESLEHLRKLYLETSQELTVTKAALARIQSESLVVDDELLENNELAAAAVSSKSPLAFKDLSLTNDLAEVSEEHRLYHRPSETLKELTAQDIKQKNKLSQENSPNEEKASLKYESLQVKLESMLRNLMRENALIATAWFDLTNRLQSNHVVIQRRHDMPRSWLSNQRHIVTS
ncbi:putative m protein repeat protein [Golovinomyces cichoracearum]|uniref:Putative m protein repeat protein n=1 Tax=Golovinomyces cichoracearum TaxID=62708 RepID=A0A420IFR5_9PEZI|nr:putative m protein repeat protein [Golovinomyces cichoracearum]